MVFHLFEQLIAGLISAIAGLIIAAGIIAVPQIFDYQTQIQSMARSQKIFQEEIQQKEIFPEEPGKPSKKIAKQRPSLNGTILPLLPQPEKSAPPPRPLPAVSLTELNKKVRQTIVNIICTTRSGGSFNPITGSGVIISQKGIILTTSHIGQYFLLEGSPKASFLDCVIRNGDIAENAYDAELIYISAEWLEKNTDSIVRQEPKGTGENDYAFLLITKSIVQGKELPASPAGGPPDFAYAEPNFNFNELPLNFSALLASYPAGFIGGIEVQKNLGLTSTFAPIKSLYTFSGTEPSTLDIFSLGGNIVAQGGSSGGGVFDTRDGKLLGIIVTSTEGTTTSARELNAITIPHISRSFEKYTGYDFSDFLNHDPNSASQFFSETEFNRLKNLLTTQLEKK